MLTGINAVNQKNCEYSKELIETAHKIIERYRELKDKRIEQYREVNNIPQDISIKQHCLNNIDEIISNLQIIKDKISNNIQLENKDWTTVANLLQDVITPLGNHWYLNN